MSEKINYDFFFHETILRRHGRNVPTISNSDVKKLVFVSFIATGYGLDRPGIESRWRRDFSAPVQTGSRAHPTSHAMGTGSLSWGKSDRGLPLTTKLLLASRLNKEYSYTPNPPLGFHEPF